MSIKYLNYDITLVFTDSIYIQVLDTQSFDTYDNKFTEISEITATQSITMESIFSILSSYFDSRENVTGNIKTDDDSMTIEVAYIKNLDFGVILDIDLAFKLKKHIINSNEKDYQQLLYKVNRLELFVNETMKLCHVPVKKTQVINSNNYLRELDLFIPVTVESLTLFYDNNERYNEENNTLYINNFNFTSSFRLTRITDIDIEGKFPNGDLTLFPLSTKSVRFQNCNLYSLDMNTLSNLEDVTFVNCPNITTIRNVLPNKSLNIRLENCNSKLNEELTILKEYGHRIEMT